MNRHILWLDCFVPCNDAKWWICPTVQHWTLGHLGQPEYKLFECSGVHNPNRWTVEQHEHINSPPVFRRGYWRRDAKHVVANRGGWLVASKHSFREIATLSLAMTRVGVFVQVFTTRTGEQSNTHLLSRGCFVVPPRNGAKWWICSSVQVFEIRTVEQSNPLFTNQQINQSTSQLNTVN
jgi:hypothetical protein